MVRRIKTPAFPQQASMRDYPGYLSDEPREDWGGPLVVDNPDGVVRAIGIGPYEPVPGLGRDWSHGAGTPKGNAGNASGRAQTMTVKGNARKP